MAAKILKFLEEAGKLKAVPREGWRMRGIKECESVAEHTFRVAFIAMLLSEMEKCSMQKALKMALLHDLPESRVGDLTRRSSNYRQKRVHAALGRIQERQNQRSKARKVCGQIRNAAVGERICRTRLRHQRFLERGIRIRGNCSGDI